MKEKIRRPAVLNALLANCKQSDRQIAEVAKVSQPTVTRIRQHYEKTGIIKSYHAIPDYTKLGFPFGTVTICELRPGVSQKGLFRNSVLVSARVISPDGNLLLITLHRSVEDYDGFLSKIKTLAVNGSLKITLFNTQGLEIKAVKAPSKTGA